MYCLALDTSTPVGSIALSQNDQILFHLKWEKGRSHSESLTLNIKKTLNEANIRLDEINKFALNIGPGSFTGIRVGINCIRTLCYSLNKKCYITNSFENLAIQTPPNKPTLICLLNAFGRSLYFQEFKMADSWKAQSKPSVFNIDRVNELLPQSGAILVGNGCQFVDTKNNETHLSTTTDAQAILHSISKESELVDWTAIRPMYLKASAAEENFKSQ